MTSIWTHSVAVTSSIKGSWHPWYIIQIHLIYWGETSHPWFWYLDLADWCYWLNSQNTFIGTTQLMALGALDLEEIHRKSRLWALRLGQKEMAWYNIGILLIMLLLCSYILTLELNIHQMHLFCTLLIHSNSPYWNLTCHQNPPPPTLLGVIWVQFQLLKWDFCYGFMFYHQRTGKSQIIGYNHQGIFLVCEETYLYTVTNQLGV